MMAKRWWWPPWWKKLQRVPVPDLPDDVLLEILSRVPYMSLCRFRCVSRSWRALCSDPALLRKAPQTLSGFIFSDLDNSSSLRFLNLSGKGRPLLDPPLPFLSHYGCILLYHSCNGLLLLICECVKPPGKLYESDYVVCNPATKKWVVLPQDTSTLQGATRQHMSLVFDPAVSSHFKVFMFLRDGGLGQITAALIFSSESGAWAYRESKLGDNNNILLSFGSDEPYFNDTLHVTAIGCSSVLAVDSEGTTWRNIPWPCPMDKSSSRCIGQSLGHLHAIQVDTNNARQLSVWVLEDYDTGRWTLKHTVSFCTFDLYGRRPRGVCDVIGMHPESNLVFIIRRSRQQCYLMSYNMDNRKVTKFICALDEYSLRPYAPYIPCFGEWFTDGH